jgi:hypothetical protein
MKDRSPDFFLGSSEHRGDWAIARSCWIVDSLRKEDGGECLLVSISPPVIGQRFGLGDKDISSLILAPRHKGVVLTQKVEQPVPVLIYRMLESNANTQPLVRNSDIEMSAWGEIYPTLEAAECAGKIK